MDFDDDMDLALEEYSTEMESEQIFVHEWNILRTITIQEIIQKYFRYVHEGKLPNLSLDQQGVLYHWSCNRIPEDPHQNVILRPFHTSQHLAQTNMDQDDPNEIFKYYLPENQGDTILTVYPTSDEDYIKAIAVLHYIIKRLAIYFAADAGKTIDFVSGGCPGHNLNLYSFNSDNTCIYMVDPEMDGAIMVIPLNGEVIAHYQGTYSVTR